MAAKRFQGVIEVEESCPMHLELLFCQNALVNVLLCEGLEVILEYSHADLATVAVQIIETFSNHPPVVLGHNDLRNLIKYRVELVQYPQAFPQSKVLFPCSLEERPVQINALLKLSASAKLGLGLQILAAETHQKI